MSQWVLDEKNSCPMLDCPGELHVMTLGNGLKRFACSECSASDAALRSAMIRECEQSDADYEAEVSERIYRMGPSDWVRDQLIAARNPVEEYIPDVDIAEQRELPPIPHCMLYLPDDRQRLNMQGLVTISGKASSGKSWFALGSALWAADAGWRTHYLAAEGTDVIARRVHSVMGENRPKRFRLHGVEPGLTVSALLDRMIDWIETEHTLIVIDSISTVVGLLEREFNETIWDVQRRLEMFLMRARALTSGRVAFLVLSEVNAQGESKGRTLDHKSDMSFSLRSIEDSPHKVIRLVKNWHGATGNLGVFAIDPQAIALRYVTDSVEQVEVGSKGIRG